ncbi:hypothetical protein [Nocardioides sp. InS609-2]|uniref:hypothetical protein n=1 Tax=Nocardioides sp. InS609-2 TaxID=2760705 RepID=UPI0020BEB258|nr:hypothetical protein [Nocardioides sp. InS609-2]
MATPTPRTSRVYDELSTPAQMRDDARVVVSNLRLERAARAATQQPPSLRFEDFPRDIAKREISVSKAATRLANALHLHLD